MPAAGLSVAPASLVFHSVGMAFANGPPILHDVSLTIPAGDFVSLVGPSGCGKSTLLRLAAGLEQPTYGQIVVDRAALGYTFQNAALLPWRTTRGNVELLGELMRPPRPRMQTRRIAQDEIVRVGLAGFETHRPAQLSGGMKMRASLARSLTLAPRIFLFDEPFGALDEMIRERLNDELLALFAAQGFAALFVTHSIAEAVFLSRRVVVMARNPGRIAAEFAVPFPYPRTADLRYTAPFAELCGEVSRALRATQAEPALA